MSDGKVTPGDFGGMNPALRHAMEQGNVNIASANRIIRISIPGGSTYYGPASALDNGQVSPSPLGGLAFRVLYRETRGRHSMMPDTKPELEKCECVTFLGVGFVFETIDRPAWWDSVEEQKESEKKNIIAP